METQEKNLTLVKEEVRFGKYRIELSRDDRFANPRFIARGYRATPKGKYLKEKMVFAHYWNTEELRAKFVDQFIERLKKSQQEEQNRKGMIEEARSNFSNPYKKGDILYNSWGYDQTNIDFYQVTQVLAKSIRIQAIQGECVEGTGGHDCINVRPVQDAFTSDPPMLKPIRVRIDYQGKIHYSLSARHGALSLYTAGEKGVYSSWGH